MGSCISSRKAESSPQVLPPPLRPDTQDMYKSKDIRLDNLKPGTGERLPNGGGDGGEPEPGIESLNQWGKERERMVERKGSTSSRGILGGRGIGGILKPGPVVLGDREGRRGSGGGSGGFLASVVLGK